MFIPCILKSHGILSIELVSLQVACIYFFNVLGTRIVNRKMSQTSIIKILNLFAFRESFIFFPFKNLLIFFSLLNLSFYQIFFIQFQGLFNTFSHVRNFVPNYPLRIFNLFFFIFKSPKSGLNRLLRIWKSHFIGLKRANKFINSLWS